MTLASVSTLIAMMTKTQLTKIMQLFYLGCINTINQTAQNEAMPKLFVSFFVRMNLDSALCGAMPINVDTIKCPLMQLKLQHKFGFNSFVCYSETSSKNILLVATNPMIIESSHHVEHGVQGVYYCCKQRHKVSSIAKKWL